MQANHPLYTIRTQKRDLVLHHDNLKACDNQNIPFGFIELETSCGKLGQFFPVPTISQGISPPSKRSKTPSDDEVLPCIVNLFRDDKQPKANKQGVTQSPEVSERFTT